jgi:mannose-6-phosphate isomerase
MSNLPEPVGEAWMTGNECRFATGPFAGKTLGDAWPEMPPEWTGTRACPPTGRRAERGAIFPLLVKFIFAEEKLSVQVHPDDDYASRHEHAAGGRGKTEMWYAIRARPGAEVLAGMKPGVTLDAFKRAIAEGTAEDCLEHVPLRAGDAVFIPSGTAHTIGPGLVLCEIQQHSDLTYRVYDYNRRDAHGRARPLHIQKALDVIRFGEQTGGKIDPLRVQRGPVTQTYFASCPYFATEKWEFAGSIGASAAPEHFDLLIFLEGQGTIAWGQESAAYAPAQIWMLPAALGPFALAPGAPTSLLRTYVPSDPAEFARRLAAQGVPEAQSARLVHL